MKPVYLDLHIHTSNNPTKLNLDYDLDALVSKIKEMAHGAYFLLSLTDHNTINEKIYLEAVEKIKENIIVGVELHIQTHKGENTKAYHCHIYFNFDDIEITPEILQNINSKLDKLYPIKLPELTDKSIPTVQEIIETFDEYDFILLPHGGQTHATFDMAMPEGREFDNTMERNLYYNFFDGFTSRSDQKTEKTKKYLERLGVHEFVNLLTCTDNYDPNNYPSPKNSETYKFIPTWMFSSQTFGGLRLALSDSSRLVYSHEKPRVWPDSIKRISLHNDKIDIEVELTPGLNVIIGESSSGKTLLVDSIHRKLTGENFSSSKYNAFGVKDIKIDYPKNLHPHFIEQNFVISITREDKTINEIGIIAKMLPNNEEARRVINRGIQYINELFIRLFNIVGKLEEIESKLNRIPVLSALASLEITEENLLNKFSATISAFEFEWYSEENKNEDLTFLDYLDERLSNPFFKHNEKLIQELRDEIIDLWTHSDIDENIKAIVEKQKEKFDEDLIKKEGEKQSKKQEFNKLLRLMREYYSELFKFEDILKKISECSVEANSKKIIIAGYTLSIENKFALKDSIILEIINELLLKDNTIENMQEIDPSYLFRGRFKNNLKGSERGSGISYKTICENINHSLESYDEIKYKIYTPTGEDFDSLSPGLKTAIILELILNFEDDSAPLIIDQPEDNLATSYMNDGLVKSIKRMKSKKQIIFVSHSATIPMAGDAQNVILCENKGDQISIQSNPLEGKINGLEVVDYIARITDGGKSSIKKRFKKYNLKKYK